MDAQDQLLTTNLTADQNEEDEDEDAPRRSIKVREKLVIGALEAAFQEMVSGIFSSIKIVECKLSQVFISNFN